MAATRKITIEILGDAKGFRKSTDDASGGLKKFEASLGGMAGKLAGAFAVGSVVAFGKHAVDAFQTTALEAGKFADATGLSVEQSSRWREVADDLSIGADTLQTGIGFMSKTLGKTPALFEQYGVAVAHAKDGTTDINGTFLNLVDRLNAIADPAKRARVATATLGRGWQSLAELIGEGSAKIRTSLAKVSDAKVITAQELANAKKYREAIDDLGDAWEDFVIQIGQKAVPALTVAAKTLTVVAKVIETAAGAADSGYRRLSNGKVVLKELAKGEQEWIDAQNASQAAQDAGTLSLGNYTTAAEGAAAATKRSQIALEDATSTGEIYGLVLGGVTDDVNLWTAAQASHFAGMVEQSMRAEAGIRKIERAWDSLTGALSDDNALLDVQDAFDNLTDTTFPATEQGLRDQQRALNDTKLAVADYGKEILGLPSEHVTSLLAQIDEGSYYEVEQRLAILARNRTMNLSIESRGGGGQNPGRKPGAKGATGGIVTRPTYAMIGEAGPEAVIPLNRTPGSSPLGGVVIHQHIAGTVVTQSQLVDAIHLGLRRKERTESTLRFT